MPATIIPIRPLPAVLFLLLTGAPALAQNVNCRGIWITPEELKAIPASGSAWNSMKAEADESPGTPDISNQDDPENVKVMARALVYARTGIETYRTQVIASCMAAIDTENGGRTLALARELGAYIIAADLVGLPPAQDATFRAWLKAVRQETLDGKTLISTHEVRPNNWGTHAGTSRAAVAAYLGEDAELDRCAKVFRGWLGDRSSYSGFTYGDLSWQADGSRPVGINARGTTIQGHSVDGVLPDDQRRGGGFSWPPPKENYVYEALQGALGQAVILHRFGHDAWNWQDQALLRAYQWLQREASFAAEGDDTWQMHLVNYYYGVSLPAPLPSQPGKNLGWTDWTHGSRSAIQTGLHGVVKSAATRAPVSQAVVELKAGSSPAFTYRSNVHGCYRFINAPPGTYTLTASSPGFQSWSGVVTLEAGKQVFGKHILLQTHADTTAPEAPENVRRI